ncbi:MAG: glycosyltransferase family 2 protein [Candidatus Omnitrophica bacterium]|nr:glycosyltransferase family 2 protein [Candidatus Omnitrophota bacterium]
MREHVSIIIPTYNEAENIAAIIPKISEVFTKHAIDGKIIVVDDDSPDQTWKVAEELGRRYPVKSVRRQGERGLSSAVVKGFEFSDSDIIGFMDADFSHPPEQIIDLLRAITADGADLAVGSRYLDEGKISKWPLYRRIGSWGATLLASPFTSIKDPMSGFVFFKRGVLEGVLLNPIGFKIGLEILAKGRYRKLKEVPIVFKDRLYGESKLTKGVVFEYLKQLWQLFREVETPIGQFIKFCVVGAAGLAVNLIIFSACLYFLHFHYLASAVAAFFFALTSNFILNRAWTFKVQKKGGQLSVRIQYQRFLFVCLFGLGVNLLTLHILHAVFEHHEILSQLLAVLSATALNFFGSKKWAFR